MASRTANPADTPANKVVIKSALYYVLLLAVGVYAWFQVSPLQMASWGITTGLIPQTTHPALASGTGAGTSGAGHSTLAPTVIIAMLGALLLTLPVAWMYQLTRAKRGYQQSVVQLLIILPIVVAGVVVLVKDSLPLAFGLAGIVAAVRFRNTLDDSKDAVYVFLATGIGLAAAVDLPVAAAISLLFNATVLVLWYWDFGSAPVELDGRIAQRRLERARELARTGTFVAQIDAEVLRNMTKEQLEGVAQRAWKRSRDSDGEPETGTNGSEVRLRIRTRDLELSRELIEAQLEEYAKDWEMDETVHDVADGIAVVDYVVELKKKTHPDELVAVARAVSGDELVDAEIR